MRKPRHCSLSSEKNCSCGFCRFRRCLEVGMRPALVKSLAPDLEGHRSVVAVAACSRSPVAYPMSSADRQAGGSQQSLVPFSSARATVTLVLPAGLSPQLPQLHQQFTQQQQSLIGPPSAPPPKRLRRLLPRLPEIPVEHHCLRSQQAASSSAGSLTPDQQAGDLPDLESVRIDLSGMAGVHDLRMIMSNGIFLLIEGYLSSMLRWVKKLPGFARLHIKDRVALVQRHWTSSSCRWPGTRSPTLALCSSAKVSACTSRRTRARRSRPASAGTPAAWRRDSASSALATLSCSSSASSCSLRPPAGPTGSMRTALIRYRGATCGL